MRKFEEPMFKVITMNSEDVIATSIEDVDNSRISAQSIIGAGDYVEEDIFIL